jgi:hypothetical protein
VKNRAYHFQSIWNIDCSQDQVWQILTATPFSWSQWWPQLKQINTLTEHKNMAGSKFMCTWQAIGYKIIGNIEVLSAKKPDEIVLKFQSGSDIVGRVHCQLSGTTERTRIMFTLDVTSIKTWMNTLNSVLKPIFLYNHNRIMHSGEQGLQNFMTLQSKYH